ncbi:MAG: molybdopterin-dependent oxidoreductase [Opitutaceae bacterium]|nr:molybdopterin-dependent oxidoreductase [Opitutaceae bacterium]
MNPFKPNSSNRREFLKGLGLLAAGSGLAGGLSRLSGAETAELPFANGVRELVKFPGKRPLLVLSTRPPQLETPFSIFNESLLTPNDAFFVRYHLSDIPTRVDPASFRLSVAGAVSTPLELRLDELKRIAKSVDLVAVNQCSGNSRGFFTPRVNGGQLGNGAMGCARWTGVPLRAVLDAAGVQAGARQVSFDGLDRGPIDTTPDFVKALDIDHARDGEVMLAWGMNGEELPMLNGYPLRLIVPGYYGTYWVKHVNRIEVLKSVYEGFWMKSAYRIPDTPGANIEPGSAPQSTIPISRFTIRSFITSLADNATVPAGHETTVRGIAFDSGRGIRAVEFSSDGGRSWSEAHLGASLGRFAFREWKATFAPGRGRHVLMSRASNSAGEIQPLVAGWNPAGYMRNVVETVNILAT